MKRIWLLACLPLAISLLVGLLITNRLVANPLLYLRTDLGTVLVLVGACVSLLGLTLIAVRRHIGQIQSQSAAHHQTIAAGDRRRFLQRLDHELKNPLMAIRASVVNLNQLGEEQPAPIVGIETQVARLSRLTADLRKLAELETRPLDEGVIDVSDLLNEIVSLASERLEAEQRTLTLHLPSAPWPLQNITGDRDLLFLALYNVVDNALKFTRPNDTIEIRAFEDDRQIVIEIADTGPGISESDLAHIGEELYRAAAARGVPGSGLGMALVRAIVTRHAGQLTLRSRVDQGTQVTLRLPLKRVS
jgi:two-component system OmpR family sensor kinase